VPHSYLQLEQLGKLHCFCFSETCHRDGNEAPCPHLEAGPCCKLLDGKERGLLNALKPAFLDPTQPLPPIRVHAQIASRTEGPPRQPHQLQYAPIYVTELDFVPLKHTRDRSGSSYIPGIWNNQSQSRPTSIRIHAN